MGYLLSSKAVINPLKEPTKKKKKTKVLFYCALPLEGSQA
jgi:hypothetical protein